MEVVMNTFALAVGLLAFSSLAATATPCGPDGHCRCGHGPQAGLAGPPAGARLYDPDTVTTLRGVAADVAVVPGRRGSGGLHVTLEADGKATEVHVGPTWFLERQGLELARGDSVEVTGSLVEKNGKPVLIARDLKKGAKTFTLRDERGVPTWAGRR
jgi:hypothetical protein